LVAKPVSGLYFGVIILLDRSIKVDDVVEIENVLQEKFSKLISVHPPSLQEITKV
jgi:small-conductance mechanosensitive channel